MPSIPLTRLRTALPPGVKVLSADSFGSSAWSVTARIVAESVDGSSLRYFLKVRVILHYWGKTTIAATLK